MALCPGQALGYSSIARVHDHFSATLPGFDFRFPGTSLGTHFGKNGAKGFRVSGVRADMGEGNGGFAATSEGATEFRKCLRCGRRYNPSSNTPNACRYHGHMTGDRGLYSYAPPHQGVDGEWSDLSGIIVYRWNTADERPNTGSKNWKKRWTCCGEYDENALPCRKGWHVSYEDGATLFT